MSTTLALVVALLGAWLAGSLALALFLGRWIHACEECEERAEDFARWESELNPGRRVTARPTDRTTR